MHQIKAFCHLQTRFCQWFDGSSSGADHSRPPTVFPDTHLPPMFFQRTPTPVADYITRNGNATGGFPIEKVQKLIIDLVMSFCDMDAKWVTMCMPHWPRQRPSQEELETLRYAQKYVFGGVWVARDFLLQILRDVDVAGKWERMGLMDIANTRPELEQLARERLSCWQRVLETLGAVDYLYQDWLLAIAALPVWADEGVSPC